jgi:hypothetical protein
MTKYKFADIEAMARQAGFDSSISPVMAAISLAESGGNPRAHNPKYPDDSYGLFQINMLDTPDYPMGANRRARYGLRSNEELFDPMTNLKAAKDIYDTQGLNAWSVYSSGRYKEFLPGNFTSVELPRKTAQKISSIVDDTGTNPSSQNIQPLYGSSVGRGRRLVSNRKAGDSLLQVGNNVPAGRSLSGSIIEAMSALLGR